WWDYPVFAVLSAVMLAVLVYFLVYALSYRDWQHYPVQFAFLVWGFLQFVFLYLLRWIYLPAMRRPLPIPPRPGWKVGVATTFVPGAESIDMLEETVRALVAMDYPHETWVLDEEDADDVKALCARLGAYHFTRKGLPQYQTEAGTFESRSKHGNYNAWLQEIGFDRYDVITAFDPDHIPDPDFLTRSLGYFDDPEIGYVQAAQVYYNQEASFIARGAAEETYGYYSSIQMTNYALGAPIVTGCHNSHRASALKEVGGFAPHPADDLLITLNYRLHGWKGVYLPEILAKGLTPVDWSSYLVQQRRWASSALDIKFRLQPKMDWRASLGERLALFIHGLYYLQSLSTPFQLLFLAFVLVTGSAPGVLSFQTVGRLVLVSAVLEFCELYRQRFFLDRRHEVGLHLSAQVLGYAKWPVFVLGIYDVIRGLRGKYTITRKAGKGSRRPLTLLAPHLLVIVVIGGAWLTGMALGNIRNPLLHILAFLFILYSTGVLLTTRLSFPSSYDPALSAKVVENRRPPASPVGRRSRVQSAPPA
ncbi:MAG TPA: glycosyltransferase, partial [Chloroflexota bacterium]